MKTQELRWFKEGEPFPASWDVQVLRFEDRPIGSGTNTERWWFCRVRKENLEKEGSA